MLNLGCKQKLICVKKVEFGIYLADSIDSEDKVLLPKKQIEEGTEIGDELEVFIYKDSKDRIICTTNEPKIIIGQIAVLEVADIGKNGAFMDWGLEKDLLLPFKEQSAELKVGDMIPVALYVDKSKRLCATMKIYDYLNNQSPYKKDDRVHGIVYDTSPMFGTYVVIDNSYSGRISPEEFNTSLKYGDKIEARVAAVKEDGKLVLSIREKSYLQMDKDAEMLKEMLEKSNGKLELNDKSSPELIKNKTGLSKNSFKRAVGRLLKQGYIEIKEEGIIKK